MPDIIFDNCVLSNFALTGSLDIIKSLYASSACITEFVAAENMKGISQGHESLISIRRALEDGWLKEIALKGRMEKRLFESLAISLGLGEASSMAAAKTRKLVFACDDRAARREAVLLGISLTGTVGILCRAVQTRKVSRVKADEILRDMIGKGFYSPIKSVNEIL